MAEKELIEEGYYDVKPTSFGSDLSKEKRTPRAYVRFDNGLYWQGYLSKTVMKNGQSVAEKTIEQLMVMGFNGETLADLNDEGALNTEKSVNVLVVHNDDGKGGKKAEVAFVNAPYKKKELSAEETKTLKGIDVRGLMQSAKKNLGVEETYTTNDIPW